MVLDTAGAAAMELLQSRRMMQGQLCIREAELSAEVESLCSQLRALCAEDSAVGDSRCVLTGLIEKLRRKSAQVARLQEIRVHEEQLQHLEADPGTLRKRYR